MLGIIILPVVALILGLIIVFVDSKVNKNNIKEEIEKKMPGYNCGGCGFGSCSGMAEHILSDPDAYKKCRLLKDKSELIKLLKDNGIKYND